MLMKDLCKATTIINWYQSDTAMHLVGPPGCGKTTVAIVDFPRMLTEHFGEDFGVHEEVTTTLDAVDVRGFLVPSKDKNGKGISYFTRPAIIPTEEYLAKHPRGLYILDERSQAQLLTQTACGPVVLDKKFGTEHFLAFAKAHPGDFATEVPSEPKPYNTPRSYTMAWNFLKHVAGTDANGHPNMKIVTDHVSQEFVAGYIGDGAAAELFAFLKVADDLPTIEEILANPGKAKAPDRLDAAYAGVQLCLHHADAKNIDKIWEWTERLPLELQTSAAKSMLERSGGQLLNSRRLGKWITKNRALVLQTTY